MPEVCFCRLLRCYRGAPSPLELLDGDVLSQQAYVLPREATTRLVRTAAQHPLAGVIERVRAQSA